MGTAGGFRSGTGLRPALIQWRADKGEAEGEYKEIAIYDPGLGIHVARLPAAPAGTDCLRFRLTGDGWSDEAEYEVLVINGAGN